MGIKRMKAAAATLGMMAVVTGAASAAETESWEPKGTTVPLSALPAAASATVKEFGKGGTIDHVLLTDEDGVKVYQIAVKLAGEAMMEIQTTLDGVLNMREEKIATEDLPAAAKARVAKARPGDKITSVERVVRTVYEVNLTDAKGKWHEVLVTPGGQLAPAPEELGEGGATKESSAEKGEKDEADEAPAKAKSGKAAKPTSEKEKD